MAELTAEGTFRGMATGWRLIQPKDSQTVGVAVSFEATEQYDRNAREWFPLDQAPWQSEGVWWVRKRDGTLNERAYEELCGVLGWDGSTKMVADNPELDFLASFSVKREEYQGNVRWKACFLNPFEDAPAGGGPTSDEAAALDQEFGGQARALASKYQKAPTRKAAEAGAAESADEPPPF